MRVRGSRAPVADRCSAVQDEPRWPGVVPITGPAYDSDLRCGRPRRFARSRFVGSCFARSWLAATWLSPTAWFATRTWSMSAGLLMVHDGATWLHVSMHHRCHRAGNGSVDGSVVRVNGIDRCRIVTIRGDSSVIWRRRRQASGEGRADCEANGQDWFHRVWKCVLSRRERRWHSMQSALISSGRNSSAESASRPHPRALPARHR